MLRLRHHLVDLCLGLAALFFAAVSFVAPFGRDQGLYYYVAREWVKSGSIPYRDVLDHKTPGIYLLHALSILVFGEHQWGIRVFDFASVILMGWIAARIATPRGEAVARGLRGLSSFIAAILAYGYLNYWDVSQSEIHYAMLGLAAVAAAIRIRREALAQVASGSLAAAAIIMKPPAAWFVLIALALVVLRCREDGGRLRSKRTVFALARFAGGSSGVIAIVFGYFAARGALPAMYDIVVGANGYYVAHEKGVGSVADALDRTHDYLGYYTPFSAILVLGALFALAHAWRAGDRARIARHGLALALALAAFAAVAMQQKFYLLHWGVMVGPATVVASGLALDWIERTRDDAHPTRPVIALALGVALLFGFSGNRSRNWFNSNVEAVKYLRGKESRQEFLRQFAFSEIGFSYADSEWIGDWLRQNSGASDLVTVRGFEPQIYAVAQRHHGGRFFWTTFITQPSRAYRRAEWLAEDRGALEKHPPKYVVVLRDAASGPDSSTYFEPMGYAPVAERGPFVVMARPGSAPLL